VTPVVNSPLERLVKFPPASFQNLENASRAYCHASYPPVACSTLVFQAVTLLE